MLRRRSLARLRREVEPVDPAALGRFLPDWQGVAPVGPCRDRRSAASAALERLAEVVDQLAGRADPGVGPGARRAAGPGPRLPAAAARRARRAGRGRLGGAGEPRPRRRPDRPGPAGPRGCCARSARPTARTDPTGRATTRSASTSRRRGASFYRELSRPRAAASDREVLDALWDLVWAGEVTNDTFAPLRALRWKRTGERRRRRRARPRPADGARPARGRRPLVAGRAAPTAARRPSGSTPSRWRCSSGTAS